MRDFFLNVLIFFISISSCLYAQSLEGYIIDSETNKGISTAVVSVLDSTKTTILYTISDNKGQYKLALESLEPGEYILTASKFGYLSEETSFIHSNRLQNINFELNAQLVNLDDMIVQANRKAITARNDTTTYRSEAFMDGTERVVEDMLKKLPGIEIDNNGTIKFKGREISKLLLDGDDLFSYNYVTGTRNISSDMIDEVQAIENWNENPLMKGIQDSQDIAINLKLKKNRADLSGNAELGYGIENRYYGNINTILIDHRNKNFNTFSYNNIGNNNTSWDYFSFGSSREQREIEFLTADKILPETVFYSQLNNQRANLNNLIYGNLNEIFRFSKNLATRINFFYVKDRLKYENSNFAEYNFADEEDLHISSIETINKNAELFYLDSKWTWNTSDNSLLEWDSKWMDEKIVTTNNLLRNQSDWVESNLNSKRFLFYNNLQYTHKLNDKQVLKTNLLYSENSAPQRFDLSPGIDYENIETDIENNSIQNVHSKKNLGQWNLTMLGATNGTAKYSYGFSGEYHKDKLFTLLSASPYESIYNDMQTSSLRNGIHARYIWSIKKWKLRPHLGISNYKVKYYQNNTEEAIQKWVLRPDLLIHYTINNHSNFQFNLQYNQSRQPISNLYENIVLTSFRTLRQNEPSLNFQKRLSSGIGFNHHDFFNQFQLQIGLNYQQRQNSFLNENHILQNFSKVKYRILPKSTEQKSINFRVEKFMHPVKSTVRFTSNFTRMNYYNLVNNSALRNNIGNSVFLEFFVKTGFKNALNFENKFQGQYFNTYARNHSSFSNTSIQNEFVILYRPDRIWFASANYQMYNPDMQQQNVHNFVDLTLNYRPQGKRWFMSMEGKNLTNNKSLEQIFVGDYYRESSLYSLNHRYLMLKLFFHF
ncbi:MAG: TonB-dependent receptor [Flavobacteriaceae bacterium]|nr:TonB-dependent receptor [Flavobacteriaceae bacterium]